MSRYSFYIDGFNVYYSLKDRRFRKYKWLNYRKLAEGIVRPGDTISQIYYFTTFVTWKHESVSRHRDYIKALRSVGVDTVLGRFTKKKIKCHLCGGVYNTREEKETDVNIGLQMTHDAVNDLYDRAVIISGDTDLVPVIEMVHKLAPDKEVGVFFPLRRNNNTLKNAADFASTMKEKMLSRAQFPDEVKVGKSIIKKPESWQ